MAVFTELARRGFSHPNTVSFVKRAVSIQSGDGEKIEMPTWGFVLLYVSFVVSMIAVSLVSYMLQEVVTTLCMVESPVAAITVSPSTHESGDQDEKEGLLETGPTITLVNQKPITSSIRGTIKHLVANAGRFARFRGLKIHVLYALLFSVVAQFFVAFLPNFLGQTVFVAGLSGAALANVHAAWTHKVVGMPTEKSFWQRVPAKSNWKTLALPAAIKTAMPYVSLYLTCGVAMAMGLHRLDQENFAEYSGAQWTSLIVRMIAIVIVAITCTLFLCLPAVVTLIRIEASILPEDQDTIVPFDRTFAGKVTSKLLGGTGVVGFLDAWRSFNWEARRRLIKLYVKVFCILAGLVFLIAHVLAFEVFAIMGPALGKMLAQAKHDGFLTR
ncbi:Nn.00g044500.m01.CDS01 [Neocucurbitaria sp. VM-36]